MWLEELFIYYRYFLYQTGNGIRLWIAEVSTSVKGYFFSNFSLIGISRLFDKQ